jgi:hypothetical protein
MRKDPKIITVQISCESPERLREVVQLARDSVALNNILTETVKYFSNGRETSESYPHKLADYFDQIQVDDLPNEPTSFRLVFHRRADSPRFWKDLIVMILRSIRESMPSETVKSQVRSSY